ncbi:MAG: aldo/keto reductase [Lachnospiraceae bacterium]
MYQAKNNRYETMLYRRCGKSGLLLSAMSLGLWHNFGSVDRFENSREMILGAFDNGITCFDLANNYGPEAGSAEITFGQVLKKELSAYRDELVITTKAGYYMWPGAYGEWGSKKSLLASLDQSLKRMELDYVDIFYHHRPDPDTPIEETAEALEQAVRSGKALYVGISNYDVKDTKRIVDRLAARNIHCLVHQMKYSMIERSNSEVLSGLSAHGMGAVAFSPLAQGILTGKYIDGIPSDSRASGASVFLNENNITGSVVAITKQLTEVAEKRGQSLSQMALAWVLSQENMVSVIIGASKLIQILENIKALKHLEFTTDELKIIEQILK